MNPEQKPAPAPGRLAMFGHMLPELSMLALLIWFALALPFAIQPSYEARALALMADGASLMFFASLIDVASRLKKSPPWWLGLLICGGLIAVNGELLEFTGLAWSLGLWVFLPIAWSLLDRMRVPWTLPSASPLEKIRRRTLTFDRLHVGITVIVLWMTIGFLRMALTDAELSGLFQMPVAGIACGSFYALNAFNVWRIYQPGFAQRQRSLMPWIDQRQNVYLNPL